MQAARRGAFFKALEAQIQEGHIQTNLVPPEDEKGETLRAMLPVTDEGDPSLLEMMAVPFVEDADLLFFYTTMIAKIGPGYLDLLAALPRWNLECPLGAFSVYEDEDSGRRQFYHKYSILFDPDIDPEELAETAMFHVMILYELISGKYKEARRISDGKA